MVDTLTIRRPDDWHLHLRDGDALTAVLPFTARQFARAIVMPNLVPPAATTGDGRAYRDRILAALPAGSRFTPLMTAYLTETTDPDDLAMGFAEGVFTAAKLYPAHATTNSAAGVGDIRRIEPVLDADGTDRHAAAAAWRGDPSGRRHLRPRGGVHRTRAAAADRTPSESSASSSSMSPPNRR